MDEEMDIMPTKLKEMIKFYMEECYWNDECERDLEKLFYNQKEVKQIQTDIMKIIHVLIQAHSGMNYGHYTPDTAVTEYRAKLKEIMEFKIKEYFVNLKKKRSK